MNRPTTPSPRTRHATAPRADAARPRLHPLTLALLAAFPLSLAAQSAPAPQAVPVPAVTWRVQGSGAAAPRQTPNAQGGVDQVISQTSQRAIYQWNSFDIGAASSVTFDMAQKGAAALNRVTGSDSPSRIFGRLAATNEGQVFLINRNGILFGRGAQVNAGALIASTLNLSDDEFNSGFTQSLSTGQAAFAYDGRAADFIDTRSFVRVDEGATIRTTEGGRIMLFAKKVDNAGTLETPGGQTMMAAGAAVHLKLPDTESALYAAESNPQVSAVRGLLVEVGRLSGATPEGGDGTVSNLASGQILTPRGNTSLVGMAVNQMGRISASTSVSENGSVVLRAQGAARPVLGVPKAQDSGALILGEDSQITIAPEVVRAGDGSVLRTNENAGFIASRVDLAGASIDLQRGAHIVAPGATVNLRAETTPTYFDRTDSSQAETVQAGKPGARIVLGEDAVIDVSGTTDTVESVARHFVTTALLGSNDLAAAPVQKDGLLYQSKVTVDTRGSSPILGDLSGYRAAIDRGVSEWMSTGGTVNARADGAIVTHASSRIDVSGGQVRYTGAEVRETRLLAEDGTLYTLNQAPADAVYVSGFNLQSPGATRYDRWGARTQWGSQSPASPEAGYVDGRDAGSVRLVGASLALLGTLRSDTQAGTRQLQGLDAQPSRGSLWLGAVKNGGSGADIDSASYTTAVLSRLDISRGGPQLDADFWLDPLTHALHGSSGIALQRLSEAGFGSVAVAADGDVRLAPVAAAPGEQPSWGLAPDSSLVLRSLNGDVRLGANLSIDSGQVELRSRFGQVEVADGVQVRLQGQWLNQQQDGPLATTAATGGSFVAQGLGVHLGRDSLVDVSGGALVSAAGVASGAAAGSISLRDDSIEASSTPSLTLAGRLQGFSAATSGGASLSLRTQRVAIGDAPAASDDDSAVLRLAPGMFSAGGFGSISVAAQRSLEVQDGTLLAPVRSMWQLPADAALAPTGSPTAALASEGLAWNQLPAGVNLSLSVVGSSQLGDRQLRVGEGTRITLQPQASLSLSSSQQLQMDGALTSHGGKVSLSVTADSTQDPAYLWLGESARIDVSGQAVLTPTTNGLRQGKVLSGGSIALSAGGVPASLVLRPGAELDAAGATGTLDRTLLTTAGLVTQREALPSAGGSISLSSNRDLRVDAALHLEAGAAGVAGGTLSVALRSADDGGTPQLRELVLREASATPPAHLSPQDLSASAGLSGQAELSAQTVRASGASDLSLYAADRLRVSDSLSLDMARALTLNTPSLAVDPGRQVHLGGATVAAGDLAVNRDEGRSTAAPTLGASSGNASLALQSRLGTVLQGHLLTEGVGSLALGTQGELQLQGGAAAVDGRYQGGLVTGGDLNIAATQVYPVSSTSFALQATSGQVRIQAVGDTPAPPLSAAGALSIQARSLVQDGVLRAPQGQISLLASERLSLGAGSITSVSADGLSLPYGSLSGGEWKDPVSALTLSAAPTKSIRVEAPSFDVAAGAQLSVAGGGELLAHEFVPGPGGATDVFAGGNGAYALVPGQQGLAPGDRAMAGAAALGRQIEIGAGAPVPAGVYTLMPARYALLAGACLIRPATTSTLMALGTAVSRTDGSVVVGARLRDGGSGLADASPSAWQILPQSVARRYSEINTTTASEHFSAQALRQGQAAPETPRDAGSLTVVARQARMAGELSLGGAAPTASAGAGLGGRAEFVADRIVVDNGSPVSTDDGLHLSAAALNQLQARTVVLGGQHAVAAGNAGALALDTRATEVVFANAGQPLQVSDVVALASTRVIVEPGVQVQAPALVPGSAPAVTLTGDGAALRVTGDAQASLVRTGVSQHTGTLEVGAGAVLAAPGGLLQLDSSGRTDVAATARIDSQVLTLASDVIRVGARAGADGLGLGPALLRQIDTVQDLTLRAYDRIDFANGSQLGDASLMRLTLDAPRLRVADAATAGAVVRAGEVRLGNSTGVSAGGPAAGGGGLTVQADDSQGGSGRVLLTGGAQSVNGAATLSLQAARSLGVQGEGQLSTAGDLTVRSAGIVGAQAGADMRLQAGGAMRLQDRDGALPALADGVHLALTARSLSSDARVVLPSGEISINTSAALDIDGGALRVAGRTVAVGRTTVDQAGGSVHLQSQQGSVTLGAPARIDVSGAGQADGGELQLSAAQGAVQLAGGIAGRSAPGADGASLSIDSAGPLDLGDLSRRLAASEAQPDGSFTGALQLRQRQGDLSLPAGSLLRAHEIELSADQGRLSLLGTLDARGEDGGRIQLAAGERLRVAAGAELLASARAVDGQGGRVTLASRDGRVSLESGAHLDLSAGTSAGPDADGVLLLRAARTGTSPRQPSGTGVAIDPLAGTIDGAARIDVEAVRTWQDVSRITALNFSTPGVVGANQIGADAASFLGAQGAQAEQVARALTASQPGLADALRVHAAVELQSSGDLQVDTGGTWALPRESVTLARTAPHVGDTSLTLRAAGDLVVPHSIVLGADNFVATSASGGNLTLVAGADLGAARSSATRQGAAGDLVVGHDRAMLVDQNRSALATSTGDITLAAAGSIDLRTGQTVVYSTGTPETSAASQAARAKAGLDNLSFSVRAGDVSLAAGVDVRGRSLTNIDFLAAPQMNVASMPGQWLGSSTVDGLTTWTATPQTADGQLFQHGVANFGGGAVSVRAGRDISHLVAVATDSGYSDGTKSAHFAAGNLRWQAGRDVVNGVVSAAGRQARITAGRDVAHREVTELERIGLDSPGLYLALGNTEATVSARRDLTLGDLQSTSAVGGRWLSGLAGEDRVRLQAASGDLSVRGAVEVDLSGSSQPVTTKLVPATVDLLAPNGSVLAQHDGAANRFGIDWLLQPQQQGGFSAVAARDVRLGAVQINAGRQATGVSRYDLSIDEDLLASGLAVGELRRADGNSLDASDRTPVQIVSATGDVAVDRLASARPVTISAGRDLLLSGSTASVVQLQDQRRDAQGDWQPVTELLSLSAGRDIQFGAASLMAEGPGHVVLISGRDMNLGTGDQNPISGYTGLVSQGNANNGLLPAGAGADVQLVVGLRADGADYRTAIRQGAAVLGVGGLVSQAAELYALLGSAGAVPALDSEPARAFRTLAPDAQLDRVRQLLGDAAYQAALGRYVRSLPQLGAVSDAQAAERLAAQPDSRRQAAVGVLLAGAFGALDAGRRQAFIDQLASASPAASQRREALVAWLARETGQTVTADQAQARFEALPLARQVVWINDRLREAVRSAGRAAAAASGAERVAAYDQGYLAIDSVFPGEGRVDAALSLSAAQVRTIKGGDITMMVPAGGVDAGRLTGNASLANVQGVVTVAGGDISAISRDDFTVNRSRVFTLTEGDILLWSSEGSIDAGRGAKTVVGAQAPVLRLDRQTGRLFLDTSGSFTGSGIAVLSADSDLDLYAPAGAIDAGEAGIRAKGNVFLGAQVIHNAVDIQVGGSVSGASLSALAVGATVGLANAATAAGAATQATGDDEDERRKRRRSRRQLLLEFLGFGRG